MVPLSRKAAKSLPGLRKELMRAAALKELIGLRLLKGTLAAAEKNEAEAGRASSVLPRRLVAEKLLRYETSIDRQLHRAIAMLEHLQERRRAKEKAQLTD